MNHKESNTKAYDRHALKWAAAMSENVGHTCLEKPAMQEENR